MIYHINVPIPIGPLFFLGHNENYIEMTRHYCKYIRRITRMCPTSYGGVDSMFCKLVIIMVYVYILVFLNGSCAWPLLVTTSFCMD